MAQFFRQHFGSLIPGSGNKNFGMEKVRKTFFNPLLKAKSEIISLLQGLPVGSAHPFSPENILLCRTQDSIDEIDISDYPEDFFYNAVDIGEMGETLLRRMAGFKAHLGVFDDFQILQAPASTFKIPIVSDQITILAVSERTPTYYDFCFADESCNACCWLARDTFPGITHSGDIVQGQDLLDYVTIKPNYLTEKELCVFISGYQSTQITRFLGTNPALLVADHVDKLLYIIPVPLDSATIGDATICCPLVIKRDGDSLICSILPKATTDRAMMCHSSKCVSQCFPDAIRSADFNIASPTTVTKEALPSRVSAPVRTELMSDNLAKVMAKETAVVVTSSVTLPPLLDLETTQLITFDTSLEFKLAGDKSLAQSKKSTVVLPCIFGAQLEGPILLATGKVPSNVPFADAASLLDYYKRLKNVVVIVDDRMTDNARNLASAYRINALFILQLSPEKEPKDSDEVLSLLNSANINAVTALAGPQSLILVQIFQRYYFYRGIANRAHLNTSWLAFGSDVTSIIESVGMESMTDPRPKELQKMLENLGVYEISDMEQDICAAVPQLQMLLNQKEMKELSMALVSALSTKVSEAVAPFRAAYIKFLGQEYKMEDPESVKKKNDMLGELRKTTKKMQLELEPAITNLSNMMSVQTTSKRTHDLQRLVRQAQIQVNVAVAKAMTFDTLAGYLEDYAGDVGVLLLNIETEPYKKLLGNLKTPAIDASFCCDLDNRVLHLGGFDAGIIIEQSQGEHYGPLARQTGSSQPILALPYLNHERGYGSMLAWVCWDEFVNLDSPYTVRWMEKCNEAHIAALRIIMRSTLSQAVASREFDFQPSSPEVGYLMSALLMEAMSKLAAMRTTAPVVLNKAEDTVTRLMRGLFGNLLTIAGSGVRPMSMVWQLFGLNSNYDIPTANVDWLWYKNVVALYPYTSWPLEQFYGNLEKFLDKTIIRVVTKNEKTADIRMNRVAEMIKYCKLRNIQLDHSRTIITVFMRMLTTEGADIESIAKRLLEHIPENLERQSQSYTKMVNYLAHLANEGQRRPMDDLVAASVYTSRSAAFAELKTKVSETVKTSDWPKMKELCQELLDKHAGLATLWHVKPKHLKVQNMKAYKSLLTADFGEDVEQPTKLKNHELTRQVLSDAEKGRLPWQVGMKGQYGDEIEPLDEAFLDEILTGTKPGLVTANDNPAEEVATSATTAIIETVAVDAFAQFEGAVFPQFITKMQGDMSPEDVCSIMNVPVDAMRVFAKALNPDFAWDHLGENFRAVILGLLSDRSKRPESRPTKKLLELAGRTTSKLIEGLGEEC